MEIIADGGIREHGDIAKSVRFGAAMVIVGIALATGGVTSHATILAKSFEIPTVVGVEHLTETVHERDAMIVDPPALEGSASAQETASNHLYTSLSRNGRSLT